MMTRFKQLILLATDWAALYLALFLALLLRYQKLPDTESWQNHWPLFTLIFLIWMVVFFIHDLYNLQKTKNNLAFFKSFLTATAVNVLIAVGFFYLVNLPRLSPKTLLLILTAVYLPLFTLFRVLWHYLLDVSALKNRLLFLGLNNEALELIKLFDTAPQIGYETAAVIAEPGNAVLNELPPGIEKYFEFSDLLTLAKNKKINTIILAMPHTNPQLNRLLYQSILSRMAIIDIEHFFENVTHRVPLSALSESWFLENLKEARKKFYDVAKRMTDVILALVAGIIFLILLPLLALLLFLFARGPIFYSHKRVGRDGQIFTIHKLRTMVVGAEQESAQFTKQRDPRVTGLGKILRLTRLDELPQTWNILKNEMSFIGPRPERPEFVTELERMMPYYNARHLIKPGLTGWSQVNYGYADTLEGNLIKLQYDLFYVKNRSILLDGVILLKTINVVAKWLGR